VGLQESLQRALGYLNSDEPAKCVSLCDDILAESPGLIQAHYLRGCAAYQTGDTGRSVSDLEIVHANHPEHLHAAFHLGRSLLAAGKFEKAVAPLQAALAEDEFAVSARYELATCLTRLRRRPEAIDYYQAILKLQPANVQVIANLASLLERENRLDEATNRTSEALQLDPANGTARMMSATLDRRNGNHIEAATELRSLIPDIENPINRSIAWNQLGQCLEGQQEWVEAFNAYSDSNRILQKHHMSSRPEPRGPHGLQTLARIKEWLRQSPLSQWETPATGDAGGLAFLVGFPRSGTTLLDRMLGAHPDIEVLEEKSLFSSLHQDWSEPGTLEQLADVNEAQIIDARNVYRHEMARHRRKPGRSIVVDKLPLNLAYLFLIYRLFPEAPVVFLQRHPMDACISCYFQAFELEASMAYFLDIRQTAEYYDAVMQVASLSMGQIANPLHQLRYEDLVAEPKTELSTLFGFLGLESDESVLEYRQHEADEISNTPSYQQVSQPLHTRSIGKWRHYSEQLEPCLPALQPWVQRFGYEESDTSERLDQ